MLFPAVPPPEVQVSLRSGPLYVGTSLTLSCAVTVDSSVNNNESVTIEWIGSQGGRVSFDDTLRASENTYEGNLTISPLSMDDSGAFTCTGTITGGSGSATNTHNVTIQVIGEYIIHFHFHHINFVCFPRPSRPECDSFNRYWCSW